MWPYWLMFLLPTSVALFIRENNPHTTTGMRYGSVDWIWVSINFLIMLMIGYRWEIGGDWANYFVYLDNVRGLSWIDVLKEGDPGFQLINWVSAEMHWGIIGVNLIGAVFFSAGLTLLCLSQPRPWLALSVSMPYLVIVVAMGYIRQGIASGLAMLGLVALCRQSTLWFALWVILAATFHKSAMLLLPIAGLAATRHRWWTIMWVTIVALGTYRVLLETSVEGLYQNYVIAEYQSSGALIRLLMNAVPAVILLVWRRKFQFTQSEFSLWLWFAIISLVLLGILFVSPSSTAVDRVALYLLPLQLVVFSNFPDVLRSKNGKDALSTAVLLYYTAVQFVWLNYADTAFAWIPYRFYPLEAWF